MGSEASSGQPRIFFFPFMAAGHMIPMLDMARLFSRRGVDTTIITTPSNAAIRHSSSDPISLIVLPLPPHSETGLPDGWDASATVGRLDFVAVQSALGMLRDPLGRLLRDNTPDCLISDMFLPWTADAAAEVGIPRLVFHGMCFFALCVMDRVKRHRPQDCVTGEAEPFVVPGLPQPIQMTRAQLPAPLKSKTFFNEFMERMSEVEARSYGVVVNSFYEMEPDYVEHYKKAIGRRAWHVGPVSLCNEGTADKVERGTKASVDQDGCLAWLDYKKPGSVLYVCFGSLSYLSSSQMKQMALGLEASGHPFIWTVRTDGASTSEWLPEGFEERNSKEGKGRLIKGWAPQTLILNHEAIGGFVTHCGWNSVLEAITAGVPMITWPMFADQSFNEKLVVDVLGIGISLEVRIAGTGEKEATVSAGEVERAVARLMGGGKVAEEMRMRARRLREVARGAVEEGGSSHADMVRLLEELMEGRNKATASDSGCPGQT